MNFSDVLNQIEDLPDTFKRPGPIFNAIVTSLAAILSRQTSALDQLVVNLNLQNARWGWLDTFGKFYGINRNGQESDVLYRARILGTLTAPHVTPIAIASFVNLALGLVVTVTENFLNTTYQLNFLSPPSLVTIQQVANAINYVRPAGVPFLPLFMITGGLSLHTCGYFRTQQVTGSYFTAGKTSLNINIAQSTNSPQTKLPTNYLSDPLILGTVTA
jgi:hypothetical protein